uniref:Uncharacterized protein n=1 Tax=Anguilla anguilla TaxID=7936 RepID=A0A0E9QMI0_ANGAN
MSRYIDLGKENINITNIRNHILNVPHDFIFYIEICMSFLHLSN